MVQEAFIKAFSKLHQYKGEVTFGAWLKRIVINKCIDSLKSKQERLTAMEESHLKVVDENYQEEWLTDDAVTVATIKATIEELPDKYRYVVMLYLSRKTRQTSNTTSICFSVNMCQYAGDD